MSDDEYYGEAKRKPKKRTKVSITLRRDKSGLYVIINKIKYRIGKDVSKPKIAEFVVKKLKETGKPRAQRAVAIKSNLASKPRANRKRGPPIDSYLKPELEVLETRLLNDLRRDKNKVSYDLQNLKDKSEEEARKPKTKAEAAAEAIDILKAVKATVPTQTRNVTIQKAIEKAIEESHPDDSKEEIADAAIDSLINKKEVKARPPPENKTDWAKYTVKPLKDIYKSFTGLNVPSSWRKAKLVEEVKKAAPLSKDEVVEEIKSHPYVAPKETKPLPEKPKGPGVMNRLGKYVYSKIVPPPPDYRSWSLQRLSDEVNNKYDLEDSEILGRDDLEDILENKWSKNDVHTIRTQLVRFDKNEADKAKQRLLKAKEKIAEKKAKEREDREIDREIAENLEKELSAMNRIESHRTEPEPEIEIPPPIELVRQRSILDTIPRPVPQTPPIQEFLQTRAFPSARPTYDPYLDKSVKELKQLARELKNQTGYEEPYSSITDKHGMVKYLRDLEKSVESSGQGKGGNDLGMSNIEIDKVLNKYPEYLGCISHDQIGKILPLIEPQSRGGIVINTDPASKPGQHWQAMYWDARPDGDHEIDFFDSYGDEIDSVLQKDIALIAHKLGAGTYLKFKENKIDYQNKTSSNCGWFSVKFLIDRFRGKHFTEASGWDDHVKGEKDIEKFKVQHGGNFGYLESFGGALHLPKFRDTYPPSVRKYLTDVPITSIQVCRKPITGAINRLLNIVSLGGWGKALESVGIDKAVHLYMVLNGNVRLERNHVIAMYPGGAESGSECVQVPVKPGITFKSLLENTAKSVGPSLQRYNPASNNCQVFLSQVLRANGLATGANLSFINQNIKGVFERLPAFVGKLANAATDTAHLADTVVNGQRREFF